MRTLAFRNGDRMPILGLGTWQAPPGEVYAALRAAIRIGYRHIDCAAIYGNEAEIGAALRDAMREGEVKREELWITSKLWNNAHGRERVAGALAKTLRDLDLAYLDLYLVHWPVALKPDVVFPDSGADVLAPSEAPLESTWAGMEAAVQAGLTRHIGVSNFSKRKLAALLERSQIKPEVDQVELHPLLQQPELVAFCAAQGVVMTAYSPLGSAGRPPRLKVADEPSVLDSPELLAIAQEHGCSAAQVAIAWHVCRGISVIPKSIRPERLRENFAAAEIALTSDELGRIARLDRHFRYLNGSIWTGPASPWTLQALWDEG